MRVLGEGQGRIVFKKPLSLIEWPVQLINNLYYFFLCRLPEFTYVIQQALSEPEVSIHVVLCADHVIHVFLEFEVPAKVLNPLFLPLLVVALLVESMHVLVCLGLVFLRH